MILLIFKILSVITNFLFVIPGALTLSKGFFIHLIFWLLTGCVSYAYHLCKITTFACFVQFDVLRQWDHIFSTTLIVVLGIEIFYIIGRIRWYWEALVVLLVFVVNIILVSTIGNGVNFTGQLVFLGVYIIFIGIGLCVKNVKKHTLGVFCKRVILGWYISGLVSIVIAYIFLQISELFSEEFYYYFHTFWHVFGALGASMIIFSFQNV